MPNLNHATDIGAPALESNRFGGANELRNHGVTRDRHCRGRGSFVEIPVSVGQTVAKVSNISGVDRTLSPPNPLFEFVRWRLRRPWKIAAFRILADAGSPPLNLFRPGNPSGKPSSRDVRLFRLSLRNPTPVCLRRAVASDAAQGLFELLGLQQPLRRRGST